MPSCTERGLVARWLSAISKPPPLNRATSSPDGALRTSLQRPSASQQTSSDVFPTLRKLTTDESQLRPARLQSPSLASLSTETERRQSLAGTVKSKISIRRPLFGRRVASARSARSGPASPLAARDSQEFLDDVTTPTVNNAPAVRADVEEESVQSTRSTPMPAASQQAMQARALVFLQALSQLLTKPTMLLLAQLAPSVAPLPGRSPYAATHSTPSTTSLSTYISASEADSHAGASQPAAPPSASATSSQTRVSVGCSEQLAASALSLPAVSLAAISRAMCALQYINNNIARISNGQSPSTTADEVFWGNESPFPSRIEYSLNKDLGPLALDTSRDDSGVFEIGGVVQACCDILSSYASEVGVELVLFHGARPGTDTSTTPFTMIRGLQELHCRGNENVFTLVITALLSCIVTQAKKGDSVEVGLNVKPCRTNERRLSQTIQEMSTDDEEKVWQLGLEFVHTRPGNAILDPVDHVRRHPVITALVQRFGMRLKEQKREIATQRVWTLTTDLTESADDRPAIGTKRKKNSTDIVREPTVCFWSRSRSLY